MDLFDQIMKWLVAPVAAYALKSFGKQAAEAVRVKNLLEVLGDVSALVPKAVNNNENLHSMLYGVKPMRKTDKRARNALRTRMRESFIQNKKVDIFQKYENISIIYNVL